MSIRSRYLLLLGLRWLATGLVVPVSLLLPLERGLSLTQLGAAVAAQGVVVLVMEVPSGALTDAWGRRPVLLASAVVAIAGYVLAATAQSVVAFGAAWAVMGLFRALDSGPLEAWFVDAEHARGAADDVPSALAAAGSVTAGAIATGSLVSAGLVHLLPWSSGTTLAVPYAAAIAVMAVQLVAAAVLMDTAPGSAGAPAGSWTAALGAGVRIAFGPHLRWLTLAMALVGVGVSALELFMPVRLGEMTGDGASTGTVMGLVSAGAWTVAAGGAAVTARVLRRRAAAPVAIVLLCAEAAGLLVMALAVGPFVLVAGFWGAYLVHSAFSGTFNSLVHARVDDRRRGTALSTTSMAFLGSAAAAGVGLGALADRTHPSAALAVGGVALLAASASIAVAARRTSPHLRPLRPPGRARRSVERSTRGTKLAPVDPGG